MTDKPMPPAEVWVSEDGLAYDSDPALDPQLAGGTFARYVRADVGDVVIPRQLATDWYHGTRHGLSAELGDAIRAQQGGET